MLLHTLLISLEFSPTWSDKFGALTQVSLVIFNQRCICGVLLNNIAQDYPPCVVLVVGCSMHNVCVCGRAPFSSPWLVLLLTCLLCLRRTEGPRGCSCQCTFALCHILSALCHTLWCCIAACMRTQSVQYIPCAVIDYCIMLACLNSPALIL